MATCDNCGNEYDKLMTVTVDGQSHRFDSFECAIHRLAPSCANCGVKILGHGLENAGDYFCCNNCARRKGVTGLEDRV